MTEGRPERVVIIGTGGAGLRAAERLRELNFGGELVMVSEEPYRTYHRPALNKQLITGAVRPRDIVLPVHTDLDAIWRYATRAVRLDPAEHLVHLPGGEELDYDGLVIATGVQARHLRGAPRHDPRVQVLRTIGDAVAVRRAIAHSKGAVVVIGGGFVACELASAAREMGRDATIITREAELLDRVPGPAVSELVTGLHRSNGVQVITQAAVRHWVPRPDGMALHLNTGQVVTAAVVVLGVGGVPAVDWLRHSGLILDDGVMCDATCHAIGAPDIVVAGDCARWPNLRFDSMPRRVEHWLNAVEMGRAAAENLLVGHESAQPFTPIPRFWSEQHGIRIQAAGVPALAQDTVPLGGAVSVGHRVTGYVSDGSLVGVLAWNSPRGMLRWTTELDKQSMTAMARRERPTVRTPEPASVVELPPPPVQHVEPHPSFPSMRPVAADPPTMPFMRPVPPAPPQHSFPFTRPVSAPPLSELPTSQFMPPIPATPTVDSTPTAAIPLADHPSFPSMRPVPPPADHPSFPSMRPVPPPADHPSFPSMRPVGPLDPEMQVPDLYPVDLRTVIR